jgi:hypothetical protein
MHENVKTLKMLAHQSKRLKAYKVFVKFDIYGRRPLIIAFKVHENKEITCERKDITKQFLKLNFGDIIQATLC